MFSTKFSLVRAVTMGAVCVGQVACGGEGTAPDPTLDTPIGQAQQELGFDNVIAMSANLRLPSDGGERSWNARFPNIVRMLTAYNASGTGPHVIGMQELNAARRDQLSAALPQYWWYSVDRGDGSMDVIFVHRDRFQVLGQGFKSVTNGARDGSCGALDDEDPNVRIIAYVYASDNLSGRRNYFYTTHFPSKNSCERIGMAKIAGDYVNQRNDKSARVIALGDFNDGVNRDGTLSTSFSTFLQRTGLKIAFSKDHVLDSSTPFMTCTSSSPSTCTDNSWSKTGRFGKMIDHVLTNDMGSVQASQVDRIMFTANNEPVWCDVVTNGLCPNGMAASSLRLYSDHWAIAAAFDQ